MRPRRRWQRARRLGPCSWRSGAREGAAPRSSGWKGAASLSVTAAAQRAGSGGSERRGGAAERREHVSANKALFGIRGGTFSGRRACNGAPRSTSARLRRRRSCAARASAPAVLALASGDNALRARPCRRVGRRDRSRLLRVGRHRNHGLRGRAPGPMVAHAQRRAAHAQTAHQQPARWRAERRHRQHGAVRRGGCQRPWGADRRGNAIAAGAHRRPRWGAAAAAGAASRAVWLLLQPAGVAAFASPARAGRGRW